MRSLRERAGLSQEALANRLGLAGKAVVSGWETGRTSCEGPAAELLLHLFAADSARSFTEINSTAESIWRRSGAWNDAWRQIAAVPEVAVAIERDTFSKLFPAVAIPSTEYLRGFPFIERGSRSDVFGIGSSGWSGAIPIERDRSPHYAWHLDRTGSFVYREIVWEELRDSPTFGHTHVASLLQLAASTVVFLARLAEMARLAGTSRYVLRLDLEGMHARGIASFDGRTTELPRMLSNEKHLSAQHASSLQEIMESPLATTYALVSELLSLIKPELAPSAELDKQLRHSIERDRARAERSLAFLDALVG